MTSGRCIHCMSSTEVDQFRIMIIRIKQESRIKSLKFFFTNLIFQKFFPNREFIRKMATSPVITDILYNNIPPIKSIIKVITDRARRENGIPKKKEIIRFFFGKENNSLKSDELIGICKK